nr:DAK2 domain-containing protein [Actinomycetota bacterium]
ADSDTGTNLLHTMRAGHDAMARLPVGAASSYPASAMALARGALLGARGNSGVILSQVLRALADSSTPECGLAADGLRAALLRADALAYASVSNPVDGTMLTVLHASAEAAQHDASSLAGVSTAAARGAADALRRTPDQLAVLARAGVVDAGGRGLVIMLDALVGVITGTSVEPRGATVVARPAAMLTAEREGQSREHGYEVMYLLDTTTDRRVQALREHLDGIGDSVVIADDGDGLHSVHVHCTDIGAAMEAGVVAGRPHRITVVRFVDDENPQGSRDRTRERALLALVAGTGVAELYAAEGATVLRCDEIVVDGDAVRTAIEEINAAHVTVLPNGLMVASTLSVVVAGIRRGGQGVTLLPTSSPVQGLAALAVHDRDRDSEDDTLAMAEAASATRRGAVRVATEQALTWVGRCEPGDVLGMLDDEVVLIARGENADEWQSDVVRGLLDRMLDAGGELVTVLTGMAMDDGLEEHMQEHVHAVHPGVELVVYPGGLPEDVLLLGVE